MKLTFADDGQCIRVDDTGDFDLPANATSPLALRFTLNNGVVEERYPGLDDDAAIAEHARLQEAALAAEQAEAARNFRVTPNGFQRWLGANRRIALRKLAATDAIVEDLMASLGFLDEIWSQHPDLIAALDYLDGKEPVLNGLRDSFYADARKYAIAG